MQMEFKDGRQLYQLFRSSEKVHRKILSLIDDIEDSDLEDKLIKEFIKYGQLMGDVERLLCGLNIGIDPLSHVD